MASSSPHGFWVTAVLPGREPFLTSVTPVHPRVDGLRKALKAEEQPTFNHYAAHELEVYDAGPTKPRQRPRDEPRLEPETALVDGHYYWVEAPVKPPAPGCRYPFAVSLSLCLRVRGTQNSYAIFLFPAVPTLKAASISHTESFHVICRLFYDL